MSFPAEDQLAKVLAEVRAAEAAREAELAAAFADPDTLRGLIRRESARLVAGIGGYYPPVPACGPDFNRWVEHWLRNDPAFCAKVGVLELFVLEYIDGARAAVAAERIAARSKPRIYSDPELHELYDVWKDPRPR